MLDRESDIIELLMSAYLIVEKGNLDAQVEEFNSYLRELPKSVQDRFFADRQQFNALRSDIREKSTEGVLAANSGAEETKNVWYLADFPRKQC